jgi:hypothetical protein
MHPDMDPARSDIDILAGRVRRFRAGDETIEIKEPPVEFYFQTMNSLLELAKELEGKQPGILKKVATNAYNALDLLRFNSVKGILFEFLALLVPEKDAEWFRKNVGLRGLIHCLQAAVDVVDMKEIRSLFFALRDQLKEAVPELMEMTTVTVGQSSEPSTSSPGDTEPTQ